MNLSVDLSQVKKKAIWPLDHNFRGHSRSGREIAFTNYYMLVDGRPYFAVSGEIHFSRMAPDRWEDELLKMKAGGINVVATYVFWNHHEEIEGKFRFDGCRDLGAFVNLCDKHDLFVVLRVGPFDHGEVRNGGLPDWLYGQDFQVRQLSERWLHYAGRLYEEIAKQVEGFFFSNDGPIIGVQIDNEYMHSSAPWEMTVGTTNEWVFIGDEGETYLLAMRDLAAKKGLEPVYFTATAWGGAIAPDSMLPLWGGYAFRPWLFYNQIGEHPLTEEYIYQNFHDNDFVSRTDFAPLYLPEDRPYACCEMGGGMMVSYNYRFQFPYKSVDAMANIKLASGCNFLGYYMYHGGTNPRSLQGQFLNEGQVAKFSYDYQAALGEYGQIRESYLRLKNLHYFTRYFADHLIDLPTVLPDGGAELIPEDLDTLRYALRTNSERGFLFLNNYQDHAVMHPKKNINLDLVLPVGSLRFADLGLASDENCILPFNLDLDGICLIQASAQAICYSDSGDWRTYFFAAPEGMRAHFLFENQVRVNGEENSSYVCAEDLKAEAFAVELHGKRIRICCLNRSLSLHLYIADDIVYLTRSGFIKDATGIRLETIESKLDFYRYVPGKGDATRSFDDLFERKDFEAVKVELNARVEPLAACRWRVHLPNDMWNKLDAKQMKDVLLRIEYAGDVGHVFVNGQLLHDNFSNGCAWEIGLKDFRTELEKGELVIYIAPLKKGSAVKVDSPMAARAESAELALAELHAVHLLPVYEFEAELR